jgi:hypothetical protein
MTTTPAQVKNAAGGQSTRGGIVTDFQAVNGGVACPERDPYFDGAQSCASKSASSGLAPFRYRGGNLTQQARQVNRFGYH